MPRTRRHFIRQALTALPLLGSAPAQTLGGRSVYFTVEDGDRLVTGLGPAQFRVSEDGQPVAFRLEEPEKPVLVTVAAEYSQASGLYLNDIVTAVRELMDAAPEGNWYSLATYSQELQIVKDFTRMKGEILASFDEIGQPFWGEVNTYDAVYELLEKMEFLPGRKVLVLVGSGLNTLSRETMGNVQKKAEAAALNIFVMGAGTLLRGQYDGYLDAVSRMNLLQAEAFLNMLAKKTGGQAFFPRFETAYRDIARTIFTMLDSQYRLVYESRARPDNRFHRLRVEAYDPRDARRQYTVRVREGWRWH
jgi:VWFA-related protein